MLISQRIPHFLNGVSQQDKRLRDPTQLATQTNCLSDPARGLTWRPPTVFDAQLETSPTPYNTNPFVHIAEKSADEKHRIIIRNNDIKAFDMEDGTELTVYTPEGTGYLAGADYRALTFGNTTIIVNQNQVVDTLTTEAAQRDPEALVYVRQGDFSTLYKVVVGPYTATHQTPASNNAEARSEIDTSEIARRLHIRLLEQEGFSTNFDSSRTGGTLYFSRNDGAEFAIEASDGLGDEAIYVVKDSVQRIEDLPFRAEDGFVVEVKGDADTEYDNHWLVYDESDNPEDYGVWRETVKPGTKTKLDPSTMPHEMSLQGGLSERDEALGAPPDPIIRGSQWTVENEEWDNYHNSDAATDTATNPGEEVDMEGHDDYVEKDMTGSGKEGIEADTEVFFAVDASRVDPNDGVRLTLEMDDGLGNFTTHDQREVLSGDVVRRDSLKLKETIPSGATIRLRQEYLSGVTPTDTYRRSKTKIINESTPDVITLDDREIEVKRKPLQFITEEATKVSFNTYRLYPGGYQIRLTVDGNNFDYTPSAGSNVTGLTIANQLQALVDADAGYDAQISQLGTLQIKDATTGQPAPSCSVTFTFQASTHLWLDELDLSGLTGVDGATIKNLTDGSTGTITSHTDNTIVASGGLSGGVDNTFQAGDLVQIIQSGTYFVFRPLQWRPREVGSLDQNPFPEFVDTVISDVFYYQGRLGFAWDDKVHLSVSNDLLNLFRETSALVRDDDAFGAQAATARDAAFHSAVTWDGALYLIAESGLMLLSGDPVLTPGSVAMTWVASYENTAEVRPIVVGEGLFLFSTHAEGVSVSEIRRQQSDVLMRHDLTEDIPTYIVGTPFAMVGSTDLNFLGVFTETSGGDTNMYAYRWRDQGRDRVISSWSQWSFDNLSKIRGADLTDGILGMVVQHSEDVVVEEIDLTQNLESSLQKIAYLDRRVSSTDAGVSVAYSSPRTTWTLPYSIATDDTEGELVVYRQDNLSKVATAARTASNEIEAVGDFTSVDVYIGIEYDKTAVLNTIYLQERSQFDFRQGGTINQGRLQLRYLALEYRDSTDAKVVVSSNGRTSYSYTLSHSTPTDGTWRIPIHARNEDVTITITNNDVPGSFNLVSAEWEALNIRRSRRV